MVLTQISVIALTIIGAALCYMTSQQQRVMAHHLSMKYTMLGIGILLLALYGWLQHLSAAAAIFTWFFSLVMCMILLPFMTLILKRKRLS